MIGLALYEEQNDVDKNFENKSSTNTFNFLEKCITSNKKSIFSIKSFKSEETLTKLLNDVISTCTTESYKLLVTWALDYSQKLLKLKSKIDKQKMSEEGGGESLVARSSQSDSLVMTQEACDDAQAQKEKRKNLIAEKQRAKVMAKLAKMQNNFLESNKEFYDEYKTSNVKADTVTVHNDSLMDEEK